MSVLRRKRSRGPSYDWISIAIFFALMITGWLMIYAVGHSTATFTLFDMNSQAGKQFMWISVSAGVFLLLQIIDYRIWISFSYMIYSFGILLLILVLLVGTEIKGATSWFSFGGISFQPAEFAKFATALGIASYLSNYKSNVNNIGDRLTAIGIFLLPAALILIQPDAGSAMVFLSFFILLYREGLASVWYILFFALVFLVIASLIYPVNYVLLILTVVAQSIFAYYTEKPMYWMLALIPLALLSFYLLYMDYPLITLIINAAYLIILSLNLFSKRMQGFIFTTWPVLLVLGVVSYASKYIFLNVLKPHQQERINVWLQPELCDPRGSLYNLLQSKMAIGSGGLTGKGFLEGTMTKLDYVPEQSTDFIFCTIGEEFGFIGVSGIVVLFVLLLWRLSEMAESMRTPFERQYAYGIMGILFIHFFVNIGMTMGMLPIIGIPLPLISYGGTSLLIFTIMFAVVVKFHSERNRI